MPEDYRDRWTNFVSGPLAEMNKKNIVDMVSACICFSLELNRGKLSAESPSSLKGKKLFHRE